MNPEKTGLFISQQRKNLKMTQKDLANKIGVTDKAISRWETGKGYPDIEIIPSLASALSITITELLNGEAVAQELLLTVADSNLKLICNNASQNSKKYKRKIIVISAISLILIFVLIISNVFMANKYLIGSDNCVVANDYSYINYYNEKYIPLNTGYLSKNTPSSKGAFDLELSEKSVWEVKVEGVGILSKLFFGESLYSVKGIADDDIVYLDTDYDSLSTQYYVKEDKFDYYNEILQNTKPSKYYAQIEQLDLNIKNIALNSVTVKAIKEAEKGEVDTTVTTSTNRSNGEGFIPVLAFDKEHIFYQFQGELLYKNEKYYWYGYQGFPDYSAHPYLIDEKYYDELYELFSYLHK